MKKMHQINAEAMSAQMFESSPIGTQIIQNGNYAMVNPALAEMFGYDSPSQIAGLPVKLLHPPESHALVSRRYKDCVAGNEAIPSFRAQGLKPNGELFEVELRPTLIDFKGAPAILAFVTEAGENTAYHNDSSGARNMDSVARLAGGIAHEFNNALAGLAGNIDLLKLSFAHEDRVHRYAEAMWKSVNRMRRNTDYLLAYAKEGITYSACIDIKNLIRETLSMLKHRLVPEIHVHTDIAADIANIEADPAHIQMLLSTVLVNAVEACETGGRIKIHVANTMVGRVSARHPESLAPGPYLYITITDNGKGMDKQTKQRAFEPYYTTHVFGRGLGLAAAQGIVTNHGGKIKVKSVLGRGTKVGIYLPSLAPSKPQLDMEAPLAQIWARSKGVVDPQPSFPLPHSGKHPAAEVPDAAGF